MKRELLQQATSQERQKETLEDNARKFVVEFIDPEFLQENNASSFALITDWLETAEDREKKVVYKEFESGEVQILLIAKVTKDGNRTSEKRRITEEEYNELLSSSTLHLEKRRYEFEYTQNDIPFSLKYDEFADSNLRVLEVDAATEDKRASFNPGDYPTTLMEVTGNTQYYGYRVVNCT